MNGKYIKDIWGHEMPMAAINGLKIARGLNGLNYCVYATFGRDDAGEYYTTVFRGSLQECECFLEDLMEKTGEFLLSEPLNMSDLRYAIRKSCVAQLKIEERSAQFYVICHTSIQLFGYNWSKVVAIADNYTDAHSVIQKNTPIKTN